MTNADDPLAAFIDAACVPLDALHSSGTLERAEAILAAHPEIASRSIYAAAIAACARNDADAIRALVSRRPKLVGELLAEGALLLAQFAGTGNTDGVRQLLDLGVDVAALYEGNGYWGIADDSMAIHVAAWRARPATVRLLIDRGSPVDVPDGKGRTPLALAVRACVGSYWSERRSPESVRALLDAGASLVGVPFPSGYAEVDELLASR